MTDQRDKSNDALERVGVVDDFFEDDGCCPQCDDSGFIITCCDDLCHGQGYCMHGDGEKPCPTCGGKI